MGQNPTSDAPVGEWKEVVSRREADHIVLYATDVESLAGSPPNPWDRVAELVRENAGLRADLADTMAGFQESQDALTVALTRVRDLENQLALHDGAFAMRLEASR